jgi:hypothetical protein
MQVALASLWYRAAQGIGGLGRGNTLTNGKRGVTERRGGGLMESVAGVVATAAVAAGSKGRGLTRRRRHLGLSAYEEGSLGARRRRKPLPPVHLAHLVRRLLLPRIMRATR